ncbi:transposase [Aurantimicrobium minutum]|uniref:Insertion element IS150 protein InsJ-like helix-turn-helix domain-containing protein n=1 Tax=Aurantimicrobium photophilum TaxID=1987356 RepID=A0A2Z3RVT4_9MICO|nr:hypothetical protein AURMO_00121 [Aurantimicrobium photophilum]AWR21858.1 hypothetical protein AURMO_01266 [Aurantimicrobium photophilum]MDF9810767.1 transposase [Aurantimicrobium minutum]MDH6256112.1 transposase [Aurantimicrobium minutum]MDH6277750.1 transposase [Aurantimicrobium minutum]
MQPNSSLTTPQREQLVDLFETGFGYVAAANRLGFSVDASKQFHRKWMLHGRLCLMQSKTKSTFSFEIKKEVVERFLAGATKMELAAEFQLSSVQLVTAWARQWRAGGDEALMPKPKGRPFGSVQNQEVSSEEDRLRQQVKRLEAENAYLKKLRDLRNQGHA